MKNLFLSLMALAASATLSATQYCDTPLTSTDGSATIQLSCENLGASYRITVKGENLNGFGGSFFNPGAVDLRTTITTSTSTEIVCVFTAASAPSLYTPLYVLMPGEKVFNWPSDIEWGSCGGEADTEAPVLTSATLVSNTHNTAIIAVEATDNVGVALYEVMNGETLVGNYGAVDGQITVKGLTPATAYTLSVKAVDAAGNKSNALSVSLTTESFSYCDAPAGHLGDANFGDPNGRILLTLAAMDANTLRVTVKPNYENGATSKLDYIYVDNKLGAPFTAGSDTEEGGADEMSVDVTYADGIPASMNFTIQWSHPAWGGRWAMDLNGVSPAELCQEGPTTAAETINASLETIKFVENGRLYFRRGNHVFDALGKMVK